MDNIDNVIKVSVPNISINNDKNKSGCKKVEVLYLNCMKRNDPSHTKCKREFEEWYDCFKLFKY
jgi:hypothetical protein